MELSLHIRTSLPAALPRAKLATGADFFATSWAAPPCKAAIAWLLQRRRLRRSHHRLRRSHMRRRLWRGLWRIRRRLHGASHWWLLDRSGRLQRRRLRRSHMRRRLWPGLWRIRRRLHGASHLWLLDRSGGLQRLRRDASWPVALSFRAWARAAARLEALRRRSVA